MKRTLLCTLLLTLFFTQQSLASFQCPDWFNTLSLKVAKDDIKTSVLGAIDTQGKILAGRKAIVDNPQWAKNPLTSALYQQLTVLVSKNVIDEIEEHLADPKYPEFSNTFGAQAVFDTIDEALRKEVEIEVMRAVRDVIGTAEILIASNTTLSVEGLSETIRKAVAGAEKRLLDKVANGSLPLSIADLTNIIARIKSIIQNIQFSRGYMISEIVRSLTLTIKTAEAVTLEKNLGVELDAWAKAKGLYDPSSPATDDAQASFGGRLADLRAALDRNPETRDSLRRILDDVLAKITKEIDFRPDTEIANLAAKKIGEMAEETARMAERAKAIEEEGKARREEAQALLRELSEGLRHRQLQNLNLTKRLPPLEIRILNKLKDEAKPPSRAEIYEQLAAIARSMGISPDEIQSLDFNNGQDPDHHAGNYFIYPLPGKDPYRAYLLDLLNDKPWYKPLLNPAASKSWDARFAASGHQTYKRNKPTITMSAIAKARAFQLAVKFASPEVADRAPEALRRLNNYDRAALNQLAEQMGDVQAALFAFVNPEREQYPLNEVKLADIDLDLDKLELLSAELIEAIDSIDTLARHLTEVENASPTLLTNIDLKLLEEVSKALKQAVQAIDEASQIGGVPFDLEELTLEDIGLSILQTIGEDGENLIREVTRLYSIDRKSSMSDFAYALMTTGTDLSAVRSLRGLSPYTIKMLQYLHVLIELED